MLFLALRAGDLVSLAAGLWFVPRYVSRTDLGAVLPAASFATFLALPLFAAALTVTKESADLAFRRRFGALKSLLAGVFAILGAGMLVVLAAAAIFVKPFLARLGIDERLAGFLLVAAALLGCVAPVYTDALQALKRFKSLAALEFLAAAARFATLVLAMPVRAFAGYFLGQAAQPLARIVLSVLALRGVWGTPAETFWDREAVRRLSRRFLLTLLYLAAGLGAALLEQTALRTNLPAADSAGYYLATRLTDLLNYLTYPILLVLFPYAADAANAGESTRPLVTKCLVATLGAAGFLALVYAFFGEALLAWLPGAETDGIAAAYAPCLPRLVAITALTALAVFALNAEIAAGRYRFLLWYIPFQALEASVLSCDRIPHARDAYLDFFLAVAALRALIALGAQSFRKQPCGPVRDKA